MASTSSRHSEALVKARIHVQIACHSTLSTGCQQNLRKRFSKSARLLNGPRSDRRVHEPKKTFLRHIKKLRDMATVQKANNMRANRRSRSPPGKKEYLPSVKDLRFSPPAGTGGAVRTWGMSYKNQPFSVTLPGVLSPFNPSSPIEDATRLTLTLRLPSGWDSVFDCFENRLLQEMVEKSSDFFGRAMSEEELAEWYKPITKKVEEYPRNLRVKMNTQGQYRTRYWGADKQSMQPPETHEGLSFNARVVFRGVWIGEDAFGIVCDCTDLQLADGAAAACPF